MIKGLLAVRSRSDPLSLRRAGMAAEWQPIERRQRQVLAPLPSSVTVGYRAPKLSALGQCTRSRACATMVVQGTIVGARLGRCVGSTAAFFYLDPQACKLSDHDQAGGAK